MFFFLSFFFKQASDEIFLKKITLRRANYHADGVPYDVAFETLSILKKCLVSHGQPN